MHHHEQGEDGCQHGGGRTPLDPSNAAIEPDLWNVGFNEIGECRDFGVDPRPVGLSTAQPKAHYPCLNPSAIDHGANKGSSRITLSKQIQIS